MHESLKANSSLRKVVEWPPMLSFSALGCILGMMACGKGSSPDAGLVGSNAVNFTVTPGGCRDVSFEPAVNYPVGDGTVAIAVGDFNSDRIQDVAVTGINTVSVLLGNGDGTFQAPLVSDAGHLSESIAVGDFNADGAPDLAVTSGDSVLVLLGNGDGTFQSPQNVTPGYTVAVGDFNGDGVDDLAAGGTNRVSILLGNGDGTFQDPLISDSGGAPFFIAVGDFNGDGVQDLALANYGGGGRGSVSVLLGNGDGRFQAPRNFATEDAFPETVAVGDFKGDGVQDLAVANYLSDNVSVLLGNGDGTFQPRRNFAVGVAPWSVAVGDFCGDGIPGLAVANTGDCDKPPCGNGNVSVLLGNGDGTFQAAVNFQAGSRPTSVAVGDFNGDGLTDLAVTDWQGTVSTVSVLINNTPRQ